jgi:hypothetical protein
LFVDEGPRIRLADDGVIARPRALHDYPEQSDAPAFAASTNGIVILSKAKDLLLLPAPTVLSS